MTWKEHIEKVVNSAKNRVVNLNVEKATISYTDKIKKHEDPKVIAGDEEISRAFLVNRLINELDYKPENIEIEKRYEISLGRNTKTQKGENDLILKDSKGDVFYLIEAKSPKEFENGKKTIIGQLFGIAREEARKCKVNYLCYYTTEFADSFTRDKVIIIDFQKFQEYEDWLEAGEPSVGNILSPGYNKPRKQPRIKGDDEFDLLKEITKEQLNTIATNLHNQLWSGGTTDSDIFYSLVNIILAKIQDESEREDGEEYHFQINAYGDNIENTEKIFERINNLYRRALCEKLNVNDEKQLEDSRVIDRNKFPLNKLVYTITALENFSLIEGRNSLDNTDILGDFFERITREGFKQDRGQFFTPITIVKFILYALKIDELAIQKVNERGTLPYIIDPSSGSGTFLIEAMKIITKEVKDKQRDQLKTSFQVKAWVDLLFPQFKENKWAREYLYGVDNNFNLGTSAKVNMILHGDGASNIFIQDGLKPFKEFKKNDMEANAMEVQEPSELYGNRNVNSKFDIIVSNPPFSVNLDSETKKTIERDFLFGTKKNSENLFIERWYQLLKEGGRLGVVLPESVFDTTENKYIRLFLFKYFTIKAVVSLPQLTFEPFTSTKTSLLFAQKKTQKEIENWNKNWELFGKEWANLKTRVENYVKVYIDEFEKDKYPSIKNHTEAEIKKNIEKYLKLFISDDDKKLSIKELLEKYEDEIIETGKFDKDLTDQFGHFNIWWVFSEVSKEMNYKIFMAEAENIGYKRTKRGEKPMPNDLFDEEVAPLFIPKFEIIENCEERIQVHISAQKELEETIKQEKTKKDKANVAKISKWNESLEWHLLENERLLKEKAEIEIIINTYYEKDKNQLYRIKDEYYDRLDETLIGHFKNGLLNQYNSYDILLRKNNVVKILDQFRKEVIW